VPREEIYFEGVSLQTVKHCRLQMLIFIRGPGGGEFFHTCPDRPYGLPSLLHNGYQVSPWG